MVVLYRMIQKLLRILKIPDCWALKKIVIRDIITQDHGILTYQDRDGDIYE